MSANAKFLAPGDGETIFSVSSSPIKFGAGALRELGAEAQALGMKRIGLFVDAHVLDSIPGQTALADKSGFELINVGPDQMDAFMKDKIRIYTQSAQSLGLGKK